MQEDIVATKNDITVEYMVLKKSEKRKINNGILEDIIAKYQKKRKA